MLGKKTFLLLIALIGLILVGCGGGGTNSPAPQGRSTTMNFPASSVAEKVFEEISISTTETTFLQGSELTVTKYDKPKHRPPSPAFVPTGSEVEIVSSKEPDSNFKLSYNNVSIPAGTILVVCVETESGWEKLVHEPYGNSINVEIDRTKRVYLDSTRSINYGWRVLIGLIKLVSPSEQMNLVRISGEGSLGPQSAIYVHGIFDGYLDGKELATSIANKHGCKNVYSLSYDWRLPCYKVASYLSSELNKLKVRDECRKRLIIIGHSRGAVIARYVLEKSRASECISDAYFICGPFKGSYWANVVDVLFYLTKSLLNSTYNVLFPFEGQAFLEELSAGGAFVTDLNNHSGDRSLTNYVLVSASDDKFVSADSAEMWGCRLENMIAGRVNIFSIYGDHSGVKSDTNQINQILEKAFSFVETDDISITTDAQKNLSAGVYWNERYTLKNNGTENVTVEEMTFNCWDRHGVWGSTEWYDDALIGGFLPKNYSRWGYRLGPGESISVSLISWVDDKKTPVREAPENLQAISEKVLVKYHTNSGKIGTTSLDVVLYYGSAWPETPKTRERTGASRISRLVKKAY